MSTKPIRLFEIPPSPNNIKVRVAMNFKGIPFERIPLTHDASGKDLDRTAVIAATRQPLTPSIEHEGRTLFDSAAILRYLEANFPGTPPLFSTDVDTLRAIENEERWARSELSAPFTKVIRMFFTGQVDDAAVEQANREFQAVTGRIETILERSPWLVGDAMTAADVTAAPYVFGAMIPEQAAAAGGPVAFLHENFQLGEGRERTRAWVGQVMAYDPMPLPA